MTTINSKMGFKPAGKRSMMKLPTDSAIRNRVTAAKCPACNRTGARLSKAKGPNPFTDDDGHVCIWLWCVCCNHVWELPRE